MFEIIICGLVIFFMTTGCSHAIVAKRCAKVEVTEYEERKDQSLCDSLWFWE